MKLLSQCVLCTPYDSDRWWSCCLKALYPASLVLDLHESHSRDGYEVNTRLGLNIGEQKKKGIV
jgi:hypothetical protein